MRSESSRRVLPTKVTWRHKLFCGVALCTMAAGGFASAVAASGESNTNDGNTTTPIKHVIVIIGENRTFDHLFATYQPVNKGETVLNLLSQGIVKDDGTPGTSYAAGIQNQAMDTTEDQKTYLNSPPKTRPYTTLPTPLAGGGYTQTITGRRSTDSRPS
jgi:phospholipase C